MKTLKRFFVAAALCRRWAAALVVVGALGVPAGALAQLTIEASGVPDSGVTTGSPGQATLVAADTAAAGVV